MYRNILDFLGEVLLECEEDSDTKRNLNCQVVKLSDTILSSEAPDLVD